MSEENTSAVVGHVQMLGLKAKDKVSNFKGVITSISFDLFGCVQAVIQPDSEDGKYKDGHWFDVSRIEVLSDDKVIETPNFDKGYIADGKKGAADKPIF